MTEPSLLARSTGLVDGLLRGTRGTDPTRPEEEIVPLRDAILIAVPLAAFYGLCMGLGVGPAAAVMNLIKIPLVLVLASVICLPSFYVFSALTGSSIRATQAVRSLAAFALLTSVVWAALAPVTGFFTLSTSPASPFIAVLHGIVLGLGLLVGAIFLGREVTGSRLATPPPPLAPTPLPPGEGQEPPLPPRPVPDEGAVSLGFFLVWLVVFGFVVCQLFADFAPFLEEGPFVNPEPRFFLEELGGGTTGR
jgi:hypothetical protein